jgi:hypothetical protein
MDLSAINLELTKRIQRSYDEEHACITRCEQELREEIESFLIIYTVYEKETIILINPKKEVNLEPIEEVIRKKYHTLWPPADLAKYLRYCYRMDPIIWKFHPEFYRGYNLQEYFWIKIHMGIWTKIMSYDLVDSTGYLGSLTDVKKSEIDVFSEMHNLQWSSSQLTSDEYESFKLERQCSDLSKVCMPVLQKPFRTFSSCKIRLPFPIIVLPESSELPKPLSAFLPTPVPTTPEKSSGLVASNSASGLSKHGISPLFKEIRVPNEFDIESGNGSDEK